MPHAWIASSTRRCYLATPPENRRNARILAARGQQVSFQAAIRTAERPLTVTAAVSVPAGVTARVRRVGHVPVRYLTTEVPVDDLDGVGQVPGLVPDPLFDESMLTAGPWETGTFWVTLRVAEDMPPGEYRVRVSLGTSEEPLPDLSVRLLVSPAAQAARTDFPVTHWLHVDALCDWYGHASFDDAFWRTLGWYLDDYVAHGSDLIYVPLFTPPLDGTRRPTQLLGVHAGESGEYTFDWTLVRRFVVECRAHGLSQFEWTHLFSQWGAAHPPVIYHGHGADRRALWAADAPATSGRYVDFLAQFLPQLERFLRVEGLTEHSFFHLSDEPSGEEALGGYRQARALVARLAPWMRVIDALSDIRFAEEGLVDEPVALLPQAQQFVHAGLPTWAYFCCVPRGRYLNRFLDTPLSTVAMSGWLLHSTGVKGFLHWGYNYWYRSQTAELIDPYQVTDGGAWPTWPSGDTCQVYPGPAGPVDSIRWEVFAESLQDLAMLRALRLSRDSELLAPVRGFDDFPRGESWLAAARHRLIGMVAAAQG